MPPGEGVREESSGPQGLILHAAWDPTSNGVFLWGEAPPGGPRPRKSKKAGALPPHPQAAVVETLKLALPSLEKARTARRIMVFPSTPEGPLHSRDAAAPAALTLERYDVTGVALPPERAVEILPATADLALIPGGPKQGDDLRWWSRAALLALSLLARGRFVPDFRDGRARWRALVTDPADASMVDGLARAMPGSARAVLEDDDEETATLPPRAALTTFLDAVIDGAVREDVPPPARALAAAPGPGAAWLRALGEEGAAVEFPPAEGDLLEREVEPWLAPVATARGTFRVAFDLEPPPPLSEEEMVDDVAPASNELWTLRYLFEAADDPNLRIPLDDVWRVTEARLRVLDRTIEHPQERALADLAVAAKEFKPIQRSLREAAPSAVLLTPAEALDFMRRGAKELEDLGFGVVLPGGRGARRPTRPLNVKLTLRPIGKEGTNLGLGALVDYRWDIAVGNRVLTNDELDRFMRLKVPLVRVGGEWIEIRENEIRETRRYWTQRRREGLTLGEAVRLQAGQSEKKGGKMEVAQIDAHGNLGEALLALAPSAKGDEKKKEPQEWVAPEGFQGKLRPYQERGVKWLTRLDQAGLGALLADDMGLGKTVQVLAMLLQAKESGREGGPTLLLAPTSVVANWEREARKFTPTLKVHVHHGGSRGRGEAFANAALESDLVLSTYTLTVRDLEDLERVPWHRVILDEAQNIKNPETRQSQAVRRLARAPHRIAMTGTPVENRISELWSIMDFLNPGYLGTLGTFRKKFQVPIERLADEEAAGKLRTLVRPFILRRVKTDPTIIQDLPEKIEQKVIMDLTREQAQIYQGIVEDMLGQIEDAEGIARKGLVLAALTRLKQVCDHPELLTEEKDGEIEGRSGKLARLTEMLEEALAEGDKALVFTQFAEMGHLLTDFLPKALDTEVIFLHGGVPRKKREEMIQRFQATDGPRVFILSLKAGGVGLNLTQGNRVFHYDRWWNPAVEDQATDRAFRIGQTKNVMVHKFVTAGTLEEKIDALIDSKRNLAKAIVGTSEGWITQLTNSELRELLSLRKGVVQSDEEAEA